MVSTKTIICRSNLVIDIGAVYEALNTGAHAEVGEGFQIDMIYYQDHIKRAPHIPAAAKKKQSFRNSLNVVVLLHAKKINFKVSHNGKFQMTGCRSEEQARECIHRFVAACASSCTNHLAVLGEYALFEFQTVMTNIDVSIGFPINRQLLDQMINRETPYKSLFETSFGYTGVNIKYPVHVEGRTLPHYTARYHAATGVDSWEERIIDAPFVSFLKNKLRYNTFLVFHSGKVIMSGMIQETMQDDLNDFMTLVHARRTEIEERAT